ncbi:hypothetical protein C1H46_040224 [Malus baccata]|uniref:ATPase AAA-type core domain-containing protein n=1 Tax=Malus baccata TaxID=106549 RepID=A0A540KJP7_MALBA|nr:hypothetical protein C1H46_040224 [Malus baccata]
MLWFKLVKPISLYTSSYLGVKSNRIRKLIMESKKLDLTSHVLFLFVFFLLGQKTQLITIRSQPQRVGLQVTSRLPQKVRGSRVPLSCSSAVFCNSMNPNAVVFSRSYLPCPANKDFPLVFSLYFHYNCHLRSRARTGNKKCLTEVKAATVAPPKEASTSAPVPTQQKKNLRILVASGGIEGLEKQIQELVEAIVLPMTHHERFQKLGVRAPKGVLLYGPPRTSKTLMARACAAQTKATFLKLAGPQLVDVQIH